jgi:hypothetical protein
MARERLLMALAILAGTGCQPATPECLTDEAFFRDRLQADVLEPVCAGCHGAGGAAGDSAFVLASPAMPDRNERDRATLSSLAGLERDGTSLVLLKPLGDEDHGGGAVLSADSAEMDLLREFVRRLDAPITSCADGPDQDGALVLLPPEQTLRKAALLLAGRLPRPEERQALVDGTVSLEQAIDGITADEAFVQTTQELWNDRLLTDRFLPGEDALDLLDYERFPNAYWFEGYDGNVRNRMRDRSNDGLAREPLEILGIIVREDRDFRQLLTGDWTAVNGYSGVTLGVVADHPDVDDPAADRFFPATLPGHPHAGVLTTPAFLARFPTTDTNRNRHRARIFFDRFLATDILALADRPIDANESTVHNPTMNDPTCTVCHAVIDPVAGAFQNWDALGRLDPFNEGWYAEMRPPGFGDAELPAAQLPGALQWLGQRTVEDPRFATATVRTVLGGLTDIPLLTAATAGDDPVRRAALAQQDELVAELAAAFAADWNYRALVRRAVLSRWFRATGHEDADDGALLLAGMAQRLGPERLDRKIEAVTGQPWQRDVDDDRYLIDRYRLLFGGIDSAAVTERLREPDGVMVSIGLRMATEVACQAVPRDFVLSRGQRRLFPRVEPDHVPETPQGFAVPEVEAGIRANLVHLFDRVLGETVTAEHPDVDAGYALWLEAWRENRDRIDAGELGAQLPNRCRATRDFETEAQLPEERRVTHDPDGTVRAWMAVTAWLLTDYRFLYE